MASDREDIAAYAAMVIKRLGPGSGIDFGFNRASVAWVDDFIEGSRTDPGFDPDKPGIVETLGCFIGECIVVNAPGSWEFFPEQDAWGVRLGNSGAFPLAKVDKQVRNGHEAGDSVLSFYDTAVDFVAKGGLDH